MSATILPQKRGGRSRDHRNSRCSHQIRRQLGKAHLSVHRRQNALPARIRYCVLSLDAYRRLRYLPGNSPLGLFLFLLAAALSQYKHSKHPTGTKHAKYYRHNLRLFCKSEAIYCFSFCRQSHNTSTCGSDRWSF